MSKCKNVNTKIVVMVNV